MKQLLKTALSIFLVAAILASLSACAPSAGKEPAVAPPSTVNEPISEPADEQNNESQAIAEPEETILLEDDFIKATYQEVFEADGVDGVFYLSLLVENKCDQEITVYLSNASVNGTELTVGSGIPMTIQPGNKSKNPFIFSYSQLTISSIEELEKITFQFTVFDENFSTLEETDPVTIQFP